MHRWPEAEVVAAVVEKHSCFKCTFLFKDVESWEMPQFYTWECNSRPHNSMLRQFPFRNTKCDKWRPFVRGQIGYGEWDPCRVLQEADQEEESDAS